MPNIKAPITGIPDTATVDIVLRYSTEQLDAQGIPAPEYRLRSTDGGATWVDLATNAAPDVPASGEGDPYPTEPVEVQITVSTLGRARTGTMWVLPVQDGAGDFDLSKPVSPRGWVAPASLADLIASTQAARDSVTQATTDLTAERQAVQQALADAGQVTLGVAERLNLLDALTTQGSSLTPALIWPADRLRYTGFPNNVAWDPGVEWTYTVTGAEGATVLAVNVAQSSPLAEVGGNAWAASVLHDDGVYRVYPVVGADSGAGTLTLGEPLRAPATNAALKSVHWHSNHLTPSGYDVLAQILVDAQQADATARYALAASHGTDTAGTWEVIGGLTTGGLTTAGDPKGLIYDDVRGQTDPDLGGQAIVSSIGTHTTLVGMDAQGHGAQQRVDLAGRRGTLRATVGVRRGVALIEVLLDGVVVATRVQPRGNVTLTVPFNGAQEGTIRVQQHTAAATTAKVGRVEWLSSVGSLTGPVLADGDVILLHGDSWTQFHNRRWQTSMVGMAAARGRTLTFVNTGKGGMTSRWGLWWLEYQLQQHPEVTKVILEFGVNDANGVQTVEARPNGTTAAIGPVDLAEYQRNMAAMVALCQRYGVQPVVVGMSVAGHPDEQALRGQWQDQLFRPARLTGGAGTLAAQSITGGTATVGGALTITTQEANSGTRQGLDVQAATAPTGGALQVWSVAGEAQPRAQVRHDGTWDSPAADLDAGYSGGVLFGGVQRLWVRDGNLILSGPGAARIETDEGLLLTGTWQKPLRLGALSLWSAEGHSKLRMSYGLPASDTEGVVVASLV